MSLNLKVERHRTGRAFTAAGIGMMFSRHAPPPCGESRSSLVKFTRRSPIENVRSLSSCRAPFFSSLFGEL